MSDEDADAGRETVELRDRTFQRYAIEHRVYYTPVDEVRSMQCPASGREHRFPEASRAA
ncbi:MAG: hypothetical protein INR71_00685 [Terriglobus roseus]|nr:hypothetical protein [Terriglobus roseus]